MKGFLGTGATFHADLNLLAQFAMGLALLGGMLLARKKRFAAHGICQATVMLLNLVAIALVMWPSFRAFEPQLPGALRDRYFAVATVHATLGIAAELLGIYIVLVAGTNILPQRLRFQRWKPWMRAELALWWLVLLIGVGTYYVWYLAPEAKATPRATAMPVGRVTVKVTNFAFIPREASVKTGTTVAWVDDAGRHSVEADDSSFKSETLVSGKQFEHTFTQPGVYAYHCGLHGAAGGKDMAGVVTVVK
ncbi:MAG: DUF420 domain-containing protein [Acidobacteria bacterium]|nr:DUF420 domain-containing protein [Acidobacteriota bacterium]